MLSIRKGHILLMVLTLFAVASMAYIILLFPWGQLDYHEELISNHMVFEDFIADKMRKAVIDLITGKQKGLVIDIEEAELKYLVSYIFQGEDGEAYPRIKGYDIRLAQDGFSVLLDSYILGLLPVRYTIEVVPSVYENNIRLHISSLKIGKIFVPSEFFLKRIERRHSPYYFCDLQTNSIIINNNYSKQLVLEGISVDQGRIRLYMGVSIKSIRDVMDIFKMVLPEDLSWLIQGFLP